MNENSARPATETATAISTHVVAVLKTLKALRPELPLTVRGLDQGALPLLFVLESGERRVSAVADACHVDLSTTSRYASTLTRLGLVEKTPDPTDRRAQVLVLTDAGREVVAQVRDLRGRVFADVLADWSPADLERFDGYLQRFAADITHHLATGHTDTRKED